MPQTAEPSPSISRLDGIFPLFLHQPLGQRDEFIAVPPFAQLEEASHQPEAADGGLVGLQCCKLWRHLDAIHCWHCGFETVNEASIDAIIAKLQSCIVYARALQLKMLERILSIALLEAYENREKSRKPNNGGS